MGYWLSFWKGDHAAKDRVGSKPLTVSRASVSIIGGIQPEVLRQAIGREHRDNGLCQRFLLVMPPERNVVWSERSVEPATKKALEELFDRLLAVETPDEPIPMPLSPNAKQRWVERYDRHRTEMRDMDSDFRSAWAKLEAYAARFALIFQAVKGGTEITAETMQAAIEISDWFGGEVRRVYAMLGRAQDDTDELLARIVKWGGQATVGKLQATGRKYRGDGVAKAALDRLASAGLGRWEAGTFKLCV